MEKNTLSMDALFDMLNTLSDDNKRWLAAKLIESSAGKEKNGLDEALEDVRMGRVHVASSTEDLFRQILG